jgi:geranylgeranyl diphosphate synthase type II
MDNRRRIERALKTCLELAAAPPCPPHALALRHAVFPGGARFRPRLCMIVASACGDAHPALTEAAAVAVELLHCASLVYDDLPCFDDAGMRRGSPSVHVAHGEELAILAGNALIVQAFDCSPAPRALARAAARPHPRDRPRRRQPLGIAAGQAWESETPPDLGTYHRAKTGALFESAIIAGALTGGGDPLQWTGLGHRLGEAYQVADDLRDADGRPEVLGKPTGQDTAHGRPSAVRELGHASALARLRRPVRRGRRPVPACSGRHDLIAFVRGWRPTTSPNPSRRRETLPLDHPEIVRLSARSSDPSTTSPAARDVRARAPSQKQAVPSAFDRVAGHYDLLTGLNPGYTKHLRWSAERMGLSRSAETDILDLCCGTGLSTHALARTYPHARVTGLDASAGMLAVAETKPWARDVRWLCGDAMDPAASGADGPFDGILMAYGIRNMPDPDLCLRRLLALLATRRRDLLPRVLRQRLAVDPLLWNAVSLGIIIPAGLVTAPRSDIYRYLRASVNQFDGATAFQARLARAGFIDQHRHTMDGWQAGIVHSFLARNRAESPHRCLAFVAPP